MTLKNHIGIWLIVLMGAVVVLLVGIAMESSTLVEVPIAFWKVLPWSFFGWLVTCAFVSLELVIIQRFL